MITLFIRCQLYIDRSSIDGQNRTILYRLNIFFKCEVGFGFETLEMIVGLALPSESFIRICLPGINRKEEERKIIATAILFTIQFLAKVNNQIHTSGKGRCKSIATNGNRFANRSCVSARAKINRVYCI